MEAVGATSAPHYLSDEDEEEELVSLGQEEPMPLQPYPGPIRPAHDASLCKYKHCKRTDKAADDVPGPCSSIRCANRVHVACSTRMTSEFPEESNGVGLICGKRCFNAVIKQLRVVPTAPSVKKRINWDNDGPTPDVSSLSCVLDWLTTGDNYRRRWRGGKGHVGEPKSSLASEILSNMREKGVLTVRTPQDVITRVSNIVTSFNSAADWLRCTGAGVDNEDSIRTRVLQLCAYYYMLEGYIEDSPATNPIELSTNPACRVPMGDSDSGDEADCDDNAQPPRSTPLSVAGPERARRSRARGSDPAAAYIELKETQFQRDRDLKRQKLAYRAQEMEMQREDLEMKRALSEAQAKEANARTAQVLLQAKVTLLRERRNLAAEGVPQHEIDLLLPLTSELEHVRE